MVTDIDWDIEFSCNNVNENWDKFEAFYRNAMELCIPISRSTKKQKNHWLTNDLKKQIRTKNPMYCENHKNNWSISNYQATYNKMKIETARMIKSAVKNYEYILATIAKCKPKLIYQYVNSKRQSRHHMKALKDDYGNIVSDTTEIAEQLNSYFSSIYTIEDTATNKKSNKRTDDVMQQIKISTEVVLAQLHALHPRRSMGPDGIHPLVLRETANAIAIPPTLIFNQSYQAGTLPDSWKLAHARPVFRKDNMLRSSNSRPISLTSIPC
jgi:hypothetical protein